MAAPLVHNRTEDKAARRGGDKFAIAFSGLIRILRNVIWHDVNSTHILGQRSRGGSLDGDNRNPWVPPFAWPPSKWRLTPAMQTVADWLSGILFLALLASFLFGLFAWFHLLWSAGKSLLANESEDLRNYLLSLGALLGVPFLIWRTLIAAQQTAINRESLYTQLFTSGVERLGAEKIVKVLDRKPLYQKHNDEWVRDEEGKPVPAVRPDGKPLVELNSYERTETNIEVRLGAVNALERVAQDSERDSRPIVETLAAYVRNTVKKESDGSADIEERIQHGYRPDVQAALDVIGRINAALEKDRIDLSSTDLTLYDVSGDMRKSDFSTSIMNGSRLYAVNLGQSRFNLAELLSIDIKSSNFEDAIFFETTVSESDFIESRFNRCKFGSAKMRKVTIVDCLLPDASFHRSDMQQMFVERCDLSSADFELARIASSVVRDSNLSDSNFQKADLRYSDLSTADLRNCKFEGANLSGATLPDDIVVDWSRVFKVTDEWLRERSGDIRKLAVMDSEITLAWHEWLREREAKG